VKSAPQRGTGSSACGSSAHGPERGSAETQQLQGIDNAEITEVVHARRTPMIPVSAMPRL
jgi:hypothetical protein